MKPYYFFLVFTLFSTTVFPQEVDSLLIRQHFKSFDNLYQVDNAEAEKYMDSISFLIQDKPPSMFHAQLYSIQALLMADSGNYQKAVDLHQRAAKVNESIDNKVDLVKNYSMLGIIYSRLREDEKAKTYHKKAIQLADQNEYTELHTQSMMEYASYYYQRSQLDSAITVAVKALKMAELHKYRSNQLFLNEHLGWYTLEIGQYDKSLQYFKKALRLSQIDSLPIDIGSSHRNIGSVLLYSNKDLDSAEYHFNEAVKIFKKIPVYDMLSDSYYNLAQIEESKSNYNKAIDYLNKAQEINERTGFRGMYYATKQLLAKQYLNLKQYDKSSKLYEEIIADTIKKDVPNTVLLSSLEYNAISYEKNKDLDNALKYLALFTQYNAKFEKLEMNSRITDIEAKYQTERKEKELAEQKIATQEQEILTQKANTRNWLLAIGLLALGISAFFIWKRYKSEAKAKQIISVQKTQIENLQKEFHHRLKNDFRSINSYISIVQRQFEDTNVKERLNELKNRVTSMFKVHEILLQEEDITQINAYPYFLELSQNVEEKYNNKRVKVHCNIGEKETIVADKAIPFGIVLNEFVTNSYKYAFGEKEGDIHINFRSDTDNHYLTLEDNGKGLPDNFNIESLSSLGMRIIPMFADLYDGSYQLDGSNGVSLTITLPKKVA